MNRFLRTLLFVLFGMTPLLAGTESLPSDITYTEDHILIQPVGDFASFTLTVQGEKTKGYTLEFEGDEAPIIRLLAPDGNALPDGQYLYRLIAAPPLDDAMLALQARIVDHPEQRGLQSTGLPEIQPISGSFQIQNGRIILPDESEGSLARDDSPFDDSDTGRTIVQAYNLTIQGSECIGVNCIEAEDFQADTIRFKENNLRMRFVDTSTATNFSHNDWRLRINGYQAGEPDFVDLWDFTPNVMVFRVMADAPADAFHLHPAGYLGIGTPTPDFKIHIAQGDSPGIGFEQDTSSGLFPAQWDIAGNEKNFFLRNPFVNGSNPPLPFRIGADQAANLLVIDGEHVGILTETPEADLHVVGDTLIQGDLTLQSANALIQTKDLDLDDSDAEIIEGNFTLSTSSNHIFWLRNTNETPDTRILLELKNKGAPQLDLNNTAGSHWGIGTQSNGIYFACEDSFAKLEMANSGALVITNNAGTETFRLTEHGDLYLSGSLQPGVPKQDNTVLQTLRMRATEQSARLDAQEAKIEQRRTRLAEQAERLHQLRTQVAFLEQTFETQTHQPSENH